MVSYTQALLRYLRPQAGRVAGLAGLLFTATGLQLLVPQIVRAFIDGALAGEATRRLVSMAVWFLVVSVATQLLAAAATYVGTDLGWRTTNQMRADLADHLLTLDMSFHNDRTPGELIERIDGDITGLANFFSQFVVRVLGSGLLLVGILAALFREDVRVGAALAGFTALTLVAMYRTRSLAIHASNSERETSAQLFGFIEERVAGLDDIRANGAGSHVMRRYAEVAREYFFKGRSAWMRRSIIWVLIIGLFSAGFLIALAAGIWLYLEGAITLGTAFLFYQYMNMLQDPIEQVTNQLQELQKAGAGLIRFAGLMNTTTDLPAGDGRPLGAAAPRVEFRDVTFAYDEQPVLHDVSWTLEPGQVLGLLGRTGGGKSTITRLLFRLYDPATGSVRFDGRDLRTVDVDDVRARVGMVTQEVQLFAATVRDNLTFFDGSIDDAEISTVLSEAGLWSWLESLPHGLDTELGPGGSGLSAGEAQLVAFARVFLKNPSVVILDEPSSRLDPATEAAMADAIDRLFAGRTGIIVAHRLETVERADRILVLDEGRVAELGDRDRLAADPESRFAALLRAGSLEETA